MIRAPVQSKSLATVGYDAETATLEVRFRNGGRYEYYLVKPSLVAEFLNAPSLGAFLNERIKPHHAHRKIE